MILQIQESWLFDFEFKNVTNVLLSGACIGVSAMKDCDIWRQGRLYGGCLIIYKSNFVIPINQITFSSNRLCVAYFINEHIKLLVMSVYMSVDDNSNVSFIEYEEILNEISGLLRIYNDFTIIIGADFNTDFMISYKSQEPTDEHLNNYKKKRIFYLRT